MKVYSRFRRRLGSQSSVPSTPGHTSVLQPKVAEFLSHLAQSSPLHDLLASVETFEPLGLICCRRQNRGSSETCPESKGADSRSLG